MKYICTPPEHKLKGSGLLIMAIVSAAIVGLTAVSLAKVNHIAFNGLNSSQIALQAQQYADAEASIIKATAYKDLKAHAKTTIQNSNGYQSEVILSNENDYSDTIKQKTATIKIYRTGESQPRSTLNLLKLSVEEQESGGVPIGTIIAWPGSNHPIEGGTWLLCNGQSAAAYPQLKAIVGNTVPNLNGRFLEGTTSTPRGFKEARLPKIPIIRAVTTVLSYGCVYATEYVLPTSGETPAFITGDRDDGGRAGAIKFHMSEMGNGSTVQPASYTVRYYIKAA